MKIIKNKEWHGGLGVLPSAAENLRESRSTANWYTLLFRSMSTYFVYVTLHIPTSSHRNNNQSTVDIFHPIRFCPPDGESNHNLWLYLCVCMCIFLMLPKFQCRLKATSPVMNTTTGFGIDGRWVLGLPEHSFSSTWNGEELTHPLLVHKRWPNELGSAME